MGRRPRKAVGRSRKNGPPRRSSSPTTTLLNDRPRLATAIALDTGAPQTLDPQGDLILSFKPSSTVQLLVSSAVLRLASPVFAAMLLPGFREGDQLAQNAFRSERTVVNLPEDDPDAMLVLCEIIHHRHDREDSWYPGLGLLGMLAALCHKYDCVAPFRLICEDWMLRHFPRQDTFNVGNQKDIWKRLLLLSYLFDNATVFQDASRGVIFSEPSHESGDTRYDRYGLAMPDCVPGIVLAYVALSAR
jgi:hypothetical protein